jgi:hypothetical protein
MPTNELTAQVFDQVNTMVADAQPNEQGVLVKSYPLSDARYNQLVIEWPAEARSSNHAGAGQIAFARRDNGTLEHFCFEETEDGVVPQKTVEENWFAGSKEYGADSGEDLQEVINTEQAATNLLGDTSDEHRPVDDDDLRALLERLQSVASQPTH